jgi:hypothetical protein
LIGLALAFALMQLSLLLIPLTFLMIALAYLKPYGQDLETLLIDMVGFFFRKKSIGAIEEQVQKKQKEEKRKDKDKERAIVVEEDRTAEVVTESIPTPTTATPTPTATAIATIPSAVIEPITIPASTIPTTTSTEQKNLLHYIVPSTKDFSLEITEKEYIVQTGESTIHIEHEQKDTIMVLAIRNGTVTDILVNRQ